MQASHEDVNTICDENQKPFVRIPVGVRKRLTANQYAVYSYLCELCWIDPMCWPSHDTIAENTNLTRRTVVKIIKHLIDEALIMTVPREQAPRRKDHGRSKTYYLPDLQTHFPNCSQQAPSIAHPVPKPCSEDGVPNGLPSKTPGKTPGKNSPRCEDVSHLDASRCEIDDQINCETVAHEVEEVFCMNTNTSPPPTPQGGSAEGGGYFASQRSRQRTESRRASQSPSAEATKVVAKYQRLTDGLTLPGGAARRVDELMAAGWTPERLFFAACLYIAARKCKGQRLFSSPANFFVDENIRACLDSNVTNETTMTYGCFVAQDYLNIAIGGVQPTQREVRLAVELVAICDDPAHWSKMFRKLVQWLDDAGVPVEDRPRLDVVLTNKDLRAVLGLA